MKAFKIFVAVVLMLICGTLASDVSVINLWEGAEVHSDHFTVVAKVYNMASPGQHLTVRVQVMNDVTGELSEQYIGVTAR